MFEPKDTSFDKDALQTPKYIFDWLNDEYQFDIDLCASDQHHLCDNYLTKDNNALWVDWSKGYRVGFCNPPYSNIDPFLEQAIKQAQKGFRTVFLIPDFNGERRFKAISEEAVNVIHIVGRISFIRPDNGLEYIGNNRGSAVIEIAKKHWKTAPHQFYRTLENIKTEGKRPKQVIL